MRIMIATILGIVGIAGGVLFCPPLREKADEVLFSTASASDEETDSECERPLEKAAGCTRNVIKSLWSDQSQGEREDVEEPAD